MIANVSYEDFLKSGIYKILNKVTGQFYIGSAQCFRTRLNSHLSKLKKKKHHNKHLMSSWYKHGAENFEFQILETCEKNILHVREQFYFDLLKPVYNKQIIAGEHVSTIKGLSFGGGFKPGYKPSAETLKKKADARLKRIAAGLKNKGRVHSEETKAKMRKSHVQRLNSSVHDLDLIIKRINNGDLLKDIANNFGVSATTISLIKRGKRWKHASDLLILSNNGV